MAPASTDARLRFLDSVSQRLLVSSPSVSAHLQITRQELAEVNDIYSNDRGRICKACGNSLILSWSCRRVDRGGKKAKTLRGTGYSDKEHIIVRCERCDSINRIEKVKPQIHQHAVKRDLERNAFRQHPAAQDKSVVQPERMESKKMTARKRARNKTSTLKSMLKASQNATETKKSDGYGLNFQDLMEP